VIFIQALEKMHAKANDKVKILSRSSLHLQKADTDSVFLSDAANHAIEIDIKSDTYTKLNANMSIEASLLQTAIQFLNKKMLPIHSLDELNLSQNKWHLALQQPPNTAPRHNTYYGLGNKQSPTDIINYRFIMPVTSTVGKHFEFLLQLRAARFTQIANHWPLPNIEPIRLEAISSPYSGHFLESLEPSSTYFFDQDGDENQTRPILAAMQNKKLLNSATGNGYLSGLRVWRSDEETLKIVLLGEPSLGAIYVANLRT